MFYVGVDLVCNNSILLVALPRFALLSAAGESIGRIISDGTDYAADSDV